MRLQRLALPSLTLALLLPAWASAIPLRIVRTSTDMDLPAVRVTDSSPAGVELSFSLPALGVEEVQVDGAAFQLVTIPGGGESGEIGSPAVPTFGRLIAIPAQGDVRIVTIVEEEEDAERVPSSPGPVGGRKRLRPSTRAHTSETRSGSIRSSKRDHRP